VLTHVPLVLSFALVLLAWLLVMLPVVPLVVVVLLETQLIEIQPVV
jgi:hypothetical protein